MFICVIKTFFVQFFCVCCHLLISSASVRSKLFLSFIVSIFAWNVPLVSLIFLKRPLVFPILLFSSISLHCSLKAFLSLLAILWFLAATTKSLQLCPTLCDPIDGSPPGSSIHGILQARTLEWIAISFTNAWKWKVKVKSLSCVRPSVTPWTAAFQAPLSRGFPGKSTGVGCHSFYNNT